jgi:amino acid transporter
MPPPAAGTNNPTGLRRVLTLPSLILFGLVYLVPLTVFTTYGLVSLQTGGRLPLAYCLTLVAMLFTAWSYAVMGKVFPAAGSAFSFASNTFGSSIGFLAGWALLLDYLFLPMINYLVIGIYINAEFAAVPPWAVIAACIVLVSVLNIVGVRSIARANTAVIAAQAVFIAVFLLLSIHHLQNAAPLDLWAPLRGSAAYAAAGNDPSVGWSPLFAGAAVLCLSFLGFDAVSTMAEEASDPTRDIPRAVMLVTLGGGVLFVILAYFAHLDLPGPTCLPALDAGCGFADNAAIDVMTRTGGRFLSAFFVAAYCAGAFGSAVTSQASVSRILYTMGRDGMLPPRFFGRVYARFGTPAPAILVVSVLSLLAIWIDLGTLASMISFGALVAFSAVNLSVIKHHVIDEGQRGWQPLLLYGLLPACGCALTAWLWTSLQWQSMIVGLAWLGAGALYLLVITRGLRRTPPAMELGEP